LLPWLGRSAAAAAAAAAAAVDLSQGGMAIALTEQLAPVIFDGAENPENALFGARHFIAQY
jgi:hypothetical protein